MATILNKTLIVKRAKTQWMKNRTKEHGSVFAIKQEKKSTWLVVANDGWFGWITDEDADVEVI